ncbi:hypothetical protein Tco_1120932 [Tanacetum coccineum]|uniref:Uncharacterized protein n=1 Tax=Tanacetum coccineum TaxID=301880 RepID=A0ABQ5IYH5_9ASTR
MHFFFSSMINVYALSTPIPGGDDDATVEQIRKRIKGENNVYVCHGLILNSNHLRIEESLSAQVNDKTKSNDVAGSSSIDMVEHSNFARKAEWLKNPILEIPSWPKPIAPISNHCDSAATLEKENSQMSNGRSRHLESRLTLHVSRLLPLSKVLSVVPLHRSPTNFSSFNPTECLMSKVVGLRYHPKVKSSECEASIGYVLGLRGSIENIVVCGGPFFRDLQWSLASLPILFGGLGLYSAKVVSSYAFVASRAQSWVLQDHILRDSGICGMDVDYASALSCLRDTIPSFDFNVFTNKDTAPTLASALFSEMVKDMEVRFDMIVRQKAVFECLRAPHA